MTASYEALLAAALLGALVDTLVFLYLARHVLGPVSPNAVVGQMLVKVGVTGIVTAILRLAPRKRVLA